MRPVDLKGPRQRQGAVINQADLCGGATHIKGQHRRLTQGARDMGREDGAAGRTRFNETHGEGRRRIDGDLVPSRGH